ncbi:hypothetical protein [Treponema phagedenis]|uniref:Uncharacterized protein n=1 Tax=Treponema phagedenis TaxID=162 RepID=A0AAE6IUP0_TREPH|nr:hypothetical protein [Treponema phagedenis]QEJ98276.1 hypothetical protein FUT82_09875 [Treponema phagedenis]QEK03787.1 hypothetical protein FUT83_08185 [Treponema phagedenis]QEK09402.1 hypothetical protein FUT81_08100 [Treponema phagedenis]
MTKEKYEEEIQKLVDEFCSLSKDTIDYSAKRETIRNKLLTILCYYYNLIYNKPFSKYYGDIAFVIVNCLKSYRKERGTPFLHYLNTSLHHEISKQKKESYSHGLKVSQKITRLRSQLFKLADTKQIATDDTEKLLKLALTIGISKADFEKVIKYENIKFAHDKTNKDGTVQDRFDNIKSTDTAPEYLLEKKLELSANKEKRYKQLKFIDEAFSQKQDRVKKYLSKLLTLKLYNDLLNAKYNLSIPINFSFVDTKFFDELEEHRKNKTRFPTQEDIAKSLNRDKTDASRTLNSFFKKIKKDINKLSTL